METLPDNVQFKPGDLFSLEPYGLGYIISVDRIYVKYIFFAEPTEIYKSYGSVFKNFFLINNRDDSYPDRNPKYIPVLT